MAWNKRTEKAGFSKSCAKLYLFVIFLFTQSFAAAQNLRYFIQFTDKNNSPYSVNRPQ